MMLCLIRWGEGEARIAQAHLVLVAQALARDIHRRIVLEIDAHVVVILVLLFLLFLLRLFLRPPLQVAVEEGEGEEEEEERDDTKDV